MLVERAIDGTDAIAMDGLYTKSKDVSLAEKFLRTHKTAKIITVINTHCLDNGYFVWTGNSSDDYCACSLLEVRHHTIHFNSCTHPVQDTQGLLPEGNLPVPLGRPHHTRAPPQESNHQPRMRWLRV